MMFDEEKTEKKEKKARKETPRYPTFLGNFKLFNSPHPPPHPDKVQNLPASQKNQFYRDYFFTFFCL